MWHRVVKEIAWVTCLIIDKARIQSKAFCFHGSHAWLCNTTFLSYNFVSSCTLNGYVFTQPMTLTDISSEVLESVLSSFINILIFLICLYCFICCFTSSPELLTKGEKIHLLQKKRCCMDQRKNNQKYFFKLFFHGILLTHHEISFTYTINFDF